MAMTTVEAQPPFEVDLPKPEATHRFLGGFLTLASLVSLYASIILTIDKFALMQAEIDGTSAVIGCDINPLVSCSGVIASDQATAMLGVPNPLWGISGFSALAVFGVLLLAGRSLPGWIWAGMQVGVLVGIGFVTWLQYQALYEIGRLCPWCMVVWACMIPMFVLVTARNLGWKLLKDYSILVIALWYIAVISAIWFRFGSDIFAG
jgi:uncharacterized membrane protein